MANFSYNKMCYTLLDMLCDGEDLMLYQYFMMRIKGHECLDWRITRVNFKTLKHPPVF